MTPEEERRKFAEGERERYLVKLAEQKLRRERVKELRNQSFARGAESEAKSSQQFLKQVARRSEFRSHVKASWLASHKDHEDMLRRLGELYRERLTSMVGRSLESAELRISINKRVVTTQGNAPVDHQPAPPQQQPKANMQQEQVAPQPIRQQPNSGDQVNHGN
jgi:hypothetical protein